LRGAIDLLAGGPPCQGFSTAGRRKPHDPRNQLFLDYIALIELVQPRLILFENVEGIKHTFGDTPGKRTSRDGTERRESYAEAVESALAERYHVSASIIRCSEFGVPQGRPRFILVGYSKSVFGQKDVPPPFVQLAACSKAYLAAK